MSTGAELRERAISDLTDGILADLRSPQDYSVTEFVTLRAFIRRLLAPVVADPIAAVRADRLADAPAEHGDTPDLTEQTAGLLLEHAWADTRGDSGDPGGKWWQCRCGHEKNIAGMSGYWSWRAAHARHVAGIILSARPAATPDAGLGSFWTQDEWSEWSNDLALLIPEDDCAGNPDGAQESIIEATLAMYVRDRAATPDMAAQAVRDAVWQQGAHIGRYKTAHAALNRELGLDFITTGGIVGRILSDLRRDVSRDYARAADAALDPGTRSDQPQPGEG